ncbi:ribonuclease H-like domain-containing protein [Tanacetum coccineum]
MFIFHRGIDIAYLLLYVDDIILTVSSTTFLQRVIQSLHSEFAMTDLGSLNYFLGIFAQRTSAGMFLSQSNLVGGLQYLTFTRLDISYFVQLVCLYMHDPCEPHYTALKRILRYIHGTIDHGLQLHVSSMTQLTAYTNEEWAAKLSCSSVEAEYRGVANVVAETAWLLYLSTNPVQHQRMKHIEIDIHFVHDFVALGHVRVLYVPSCFKYADIFTKGSSSALFLEFHDNLDV